MRPRKISCQQASTERLTRSRLGTIILPMKKLLTLTIAAMAIASFTATSFAGDGCGGGEKKEADSTEESAQS